MYPEAVADFEVVIASPGFLSEDGKAQRRDWVAALKTGQNPITSQVLMGFREKETSVINLTSLIGRLEMQSVRNTLEDEGFTFAPESINGKAGLKGTKLEDGCQAEVILVGDGETLESGSITLPDCTENALKSLLWSFNYAFVRDNDDFGRLTVWQVADWWYVAAGEKALSQPAAFGGYQLQVERSDSGEIVMSAFPVEEQGE
jgi:hypothetical protein